MSTLLSSPDLTEKQAWHRINRGFGKAINEMRMIEEGDKILVAVSGGKDSLCMLHFFKAFLAKSPVKFEILAVNLDQGQPGFPAETLPNLFKAWDVPYHIETRDTYSVVLEKTKEGKSYCSMCSKLRRGILYSVAKDFGCNKIALGHHRDDLIETFLMNALYSGQLASMPPHYISKKEGLGVIRPLYMVEEKTIEAFVGAQQWPIIPCTLCGSQEGMKRNYVRKLLKDMSKSGDTVRSSLFGALHHPDPRFLMDTSLWEDDIPII